ncbi:SdpA family antimicrobial peptide system protein [Microbacterium karelineae]|uniref:SdpA family antimicrobial peptide system protein n=1 Tax=Microbacterium karelineae TaxID=2654283 RepID=UPI0012E9C951|nr:SdpA family antimicrobial peptide system protein [Microbacterium karelineae]
MLGVVFGVVIAVSVLVQLPTTVLGVVPEPVRLGFTMLYPQGWQFFTKDLSDVEMTVYRVDGVAISSASMFPNSEAQNLLGLARGQRAQGTELAALEKGVAEWTDCDDAQTDCVLQVADHGVTHAIPNNSPVSTICGPSILVYSKPVPWGFRNDYNGWRIDERAAFVDVDCE